MLQFRIHNCWDHILLDIDHVSIDFYEEVVIIRRGQFLPRGLDGVRVRFIHSFIKPFETRLLSRLRDEDNLV